MNNAQSYTFKSPTKFLFQSDDEEEWEFRGTQIIRTEKSMSAAVSKTPRDKKNMKKSNSFLAINAKEHQKKKKTCQKRRMNQTQIVRKPVSHSKTSNNKTSFSSAAPSKSSVKEKNRSISKDFLILDNTIYECENIEEINQKIIFGSSSLFNHQRFCKLTMKRISELGNYLKGYGQFIVFSKIKKPSNISIKQQQKVRLYALLKEETLWKNKKQKGKEVEDLVKFTVEKVEKDSSSFLHQKPEFEKNIKEWKNEKLHQILSAHTILQGTQEVFHSFDDQLSVSFEQQLHKKYQCQNIDKAPKRIIEQKYPSSMPEEFHKIYGPYLPNDHHLSLIGIQSFLAQFWDFLVVNDHVYSLIKNLQKQYGLKEEDKKQFILNGFPNVPYHFLANQNLLENEIFIHFCKQQKINLQNPNTDKTQLQTQILFEKAVFDSMNQVLCEYQSEFPQGKMHPLQGNPSISAFFIDQSNIMDVWQDAMSKVINISQKSQGLLVMEKQKYDKDAKKYIVQVRDSFQKMFQRKLIEEISQIIFEKLVCELRDEKHI